MPNGNDHPSKNAPANTSPDSAHVTNFIRNIVEADLAANKFATRKWAGKPGLATRLMYTMFKHMEFVLPARTKSEHWPL